MSLAGNLKSEFELVKGKRLGYEKLWLQDLRQYKGIYDPEVLAKMDKKRSQAFIRETRTKVRTIDARVMDLLFPANQEKNWGILPTPEPEFLEQEEREIVAGLEKAIAQATIQQYQAMVAQANATGQQPPDQSQFQPRPATQEEITGARKAAAKIISDKMSLEIEDQLADLKYRKIIRDVVHSGHLYGTGFLKGPLVDKSKRATWKRVAVQSEPTIDEQTGQQVPSQTSYKWVLTYTEQLRPYIEFKHIWNLYPDLSVTEIDDMRYMYERHLMPKHKVIQLANRQDGDFDSQTIIQYISDHPNGDATYNYFETELFNLKAFDTAPLNTAGLYQVIEFWGFVKLGDFIGEIPLDDPRLTDFQGMEETTEIFINCWILGDSIIKINQQPIEGVVFPYYTYYFDKDETSIYGEGVATIQRDPQRLVNASVRAMIDNAAHCAGPQYEINTDLLDPSEDITELGAFKVWLRTGKDADIAGKEVVRIKQISSYTPEFMQMWQAFSKSGDEVTIIPRYLQGDSRVSGAGRTASGLSMLMGQANVGLSDLVKMFDDGITKPFITAMYHWNMQFNEREDIKGDMNVIARGSTALMAKEIRSQQIQLFLQMTLNQFDAPWIKRNNLLAEWAKCTDIAEVDAVKTEEEYNQTVAQQQDAIKEQKVEDAQMRIQEMAAEEKMKTDQHAGEIDTIMNAVKDLSTRMKKIEQANTAVQDNVTAMQGG